jgi:hypothetical protein
VVGAEVVAAAQAEEPAARQVARLAAPQGQLAEPVARPA